MTPSWESMYPQLPEGGISSNLISETAFFKEAAAGQRILIAERDPNVFVAAFLTAVERECAVFLANPEWNRERIDYVLTMARPHHIVGGLPPDIDYEPEGEEMKVRDWPAIMIPTGGSSGEVRFAIHTWDNLFIAADGFYEYFGREPLHNCCVLPLYHVSGLMQVFRSLVSEGSLNFFEYKALLKGNLPEIEPEHYFLSLVPTQLIRLLKNAETGRWLGKLKRILLGGGPAGPALLNTARQAKLPIAPCYGMTESAAAISLLDSNDFLDGKDGVGNPLPHASIFVRDPAGLPARPNVNGRIIVNSDALFRGYYPNLPQSLDDGFATHDLGVFDDDGGLFIKGRLDRIINSGGEKINPYVVERVLAETGLVAEAVVTGAPDPEWGECVVVIYVVDEEAENVTSDRLRTALKERLAPHEMPKKWIEVEEIPYTPLGKLDFSRIDLDP